MEKEIWKKVTLKNGTEMPYEVNQFGVVRSIRTGKEMHGKPNANGYIPITLRNTGIKEVDYIHRIVARAFIQPIISRNEEIVHKDGDRNNNCADNLEVVSKSNLAIGKNYNSYAEGLTKLYGVAEDLSKGNGSIKEIAERNGVTEKVVSDILHRKTYNELFNSYDFSNYNQKPSTINHLVLAIKLELEGFKEKEIKKEIHEKYPVFTDNDLSFIVYEAKKFAKMIKKKDLEISDPQIYKIAFIDNLIMRGAKSDTEIIDKYMDKFNEGSRDMCTHLVHKRIGAMRSYVLKNIK